LRSTGADVVPTRILTPSRKLANARDGGPWLTKCRCMLVAVVLIVAAPAPSARAATRYCGTGRAHAVRHEIHAYDVGCRRARRVIAASLRLPWQGNSPGSPRGWSCARLPWSSGLECVREGRPNMIADAIPAPFGPTRRRRTCRNGTGFLFTSYGIADVRTRGIPCPVATSTLYYWASNWSSGRTRRLGGPTGYKCRRRPALPDSVLFTCRRRSRRLWFGLGA
jgi:hypothetical protein